MKNLMENPDKRRNEIAKALNFGRYPVLKLDLADADRYGLVGSKCRVEMGTFPDGERWLENSELRVYCDECKPKFSAGGSCIHNSWGYYDIIEDYESATTPIIKSNSEFVLIIEDSHVKEIYKVLVVKTGGVHRHCTVPIDCEEIDLRALMTVSEMRYGKFNVKG